MERVIFLDKDGTLVQDVPYNVDPDKIILMPETARGLRRLHEAGYHFVLVSNQSGVARGYFKEEDLKSVWERLGAILLETADITLDGIYYCPHHPDGVINPYAIECDCRKPRPGMLLNAALDLNIHLSSAWMIGDILNDVEAGNRAGCRTILVDQGSETEWRSGPFRAPDYTVSNFNEAAEIILNQAAHTTPTQSSAPVRSHFTGKTMNEEI